MAGDKANRSVHGDEKAGRDRYSLKVSNFEVWTIVIAAISVAVNTVLLVAFALQLRLMRIQLRQSSDATERDHQQRRRQATLEFVTATFDRSQRLVERGLPALFKDEVELFADAPAALDDPRNDVIREYLNGFEAFATGVNLGLYDLEVVNHLRGTVIVRTMVLYRSWIEARRVLNQNPNQYRELETLSEAIVEHRRRAGAPEVAII